MAKRVNYWRKYEVDDYAAAWSFAEHSAVTEKRALWKEEKKVFSLIYEYNTPHYLTSEGFERALKRRLYEDSRRRIIICSAKKGKLGKFVRVEVYLLLDKRPSDAWMLDLEKFFKNYEEEEPS